MPNHFHISLKTASVVAVLALSWTAATIIDSPLQAQSPKSVVEAAASPSSDDSAGISASAARISASYGKLPVSFEVNQGQADPSVQFLARGAGYTLFLTPGEAVLSLHAQLADRTKSGGSAIPHTLPLLSAAQSAPTTPPSTVRLHLVGANTAAQAEGVDPLPGRNNYFVGNDASKWHTNVPTYAKVRYSNVYPGIDLLYYGNQEGRLEHDFVVLPGADPNSIAIRLRGSDAVVPDQNGGLTLRTKSGDLTLRSPMVYQVIGGQQKTIPATYLLADNQVKFQLGSYDRTAPLVIDPVIQYTGVFGGSNIEYPAGIAVDSTGNTYVTGMTQSINFPVAGSSTQCGVDGSEMAYVSKINRAGTALLYSSYLECGFSWGSAIAVDGSGRAYVVERTSSPILKILNPTGDKVLYSAGIPGSLGTAIALDPSGNAYIASFNGGVIVSKFNNVGKLQYFNNLSTRGYPNAIAVDASGSAYVAGTAYDPGFPITKNAYQSTCVGNTTFGCGFVTKLSPSGKNIIYSTYFGHPVVSLGMFVVGIAVDSSGNAYVAGSTGPGFPVTSNALQKTYGGGQGDGYVTKLNASGTALLSSTYIGGSGMDLVKGLAIDQYRQVYVTGYTSSPNFPLKASVQSFTAINGIAQVFVTTLSPTLSSIAYYSTYFGTYICGNVDLRIAVDKSLNVYFGGPTCGGINPTPGALTTGTTANPGGGDEDAFVSKLVIMDDLALGLSGSSASAAHGGNFTYTIAVTSKGPDFGYNVRIDDPLPAGTTLVSYNAGGGTCTAPAVGTTGTLHCSLPQLNKGATYTITLTVKVDAPSGTTLSNTATTLSNMQDFTTSNNKGTLTVKIL